MPNLLASSIRTIEEWPLAVCIRNTSVQCAKTLEYYHVTLLLNLPLIPTKVWSDRPEKRYCRLASYHRTAVFVAPSPCCQTVGLVVWHLRFLQSEDSRGKSPGSMVSPEE